MPDFTAEAPVRANKAPGRAKAASPTAINNEVDILVAKVATIIGDLVKVVVESPFSDDYAARNAFLEADSLLIGLAAPSGPNDYWDESKPRKPIADQMLAIDGYLKQAIAALLNDEAQRPGERLFRLSMAEQASALIAQLHEAYEGLPGTSAALAALTVFQVPMDGARPFREQPRLPLNTQHQPSSASPNVDQYSPEQMRTVLEFVACTATTLEDLLIVAAETNNPTSARTLIHSAKNLTQFIGATADRAAGESVVGDLDVWAHGPNFAALGKAGAA